MTTAYSDYEDLRTDINNISLRLSTVTALSNDYEDLRNDINNISLRLSTMTTAYSDDIKQIQKDIAQIKTKMELDVLYVGDTLDATNSDET